MGPTDKKIQIITGAAVGKRNAVCVVVSVRGNNIIVLAVGAERKPGRNNYIVLYVCTSGVNKRIRQTKNLTINLVFVFFFFLRFSKINGRQTRISMAIYFFVSVSDRRE